jgi:hypothetical protein
MKEADLMSAGKITVYFISGDAYNAVLFRKGKICREMDADDDGFYTGPNGKVDLYAKDENGQFDTARIVDALKGEASGIAWDALDYSDEMPYADYIDDVRFEIFPVCEYSE